MFWEPVLRYFARRELDSDQRQKSSGQSANEMLPGQKVDHMRTRVVQKQ